MIKLFSRVYVLPEYTPVAGLWINSLARRVKLFSKTDFHFSPTPDKILKGENFLFLFNTCHELLGARRIA